MKVIRFIYRIISSLLTLAIIAVTAVTLLLGISGMDRQDPKSLFGLRAYIVLSESMMPTFDKGSVIIVKETAQENLQEGDIITYMPIRGDDVLLTHRVVRIDGSGEGRSFITRGDANNTDDPNPVSADMILGRTILHVNGLGEFISYLRTGQGIFSMIGVILVGLFIIPYLLAPSNGKDKNSININDINQDENLDNENLTDETENSDEKSHIERSDAKDYD